MSITLPDAKAKLAGLSFSDLSWIYRKAQGNKPPVGTSKATLLETMTEMFEEKAKAENGTDTTEASVECAAWLDEVGDPGRRAAKKPKEKDAPNVAVELGKLAKLPTGALREKYTELYGKPVKTGNRQFLLKKVAWKLQADAHGGLSEKAKARAAEIVDATGVGTKLATKIKDARPRDPRLPAPGSIITKTWREKDLQVLVGENDFEFEGQKWRSLSAIASKLLGCPSNGFLFFGLLPIQKEAAEKREAKKAEKDAKAAEAAATPSPAAGATPETAKPAKKGKKTKKGAK